MPPAPIQPALGLLELESIAAGIEAGDIITAIDGKPVQKVRNVLEIIAGHKPGDKVILNLLRAGQDLQLTLVTTERPQ